MATERNITFQEARLTLSKSADARSRAVMRGKITLYLLLILAQEQFSSQIKYRGKSKTGGLHIHIFFITTIDLHVIVVH